MRGEEKVYLAYRQSIMKGNQGRNPEAGTESWDYGRLLLTRWFV